MKSSWLSTLLLLFSIQVAFAQQSNKGVVTGRLIDQETQAPLDFATISILSAVDSSVITGGVSDEQGKFAIEAKFGRYLAKIDFISYQSKTISGVEISADQRIADLGDIMIGASAEMLEEIEVVAEKSEMQFDLDKRTFNVGKDLANKGGSAEEILDAIPSVSVDVEGAVSLRGTENVTILVDGKPSGLIGADGGGLKSLPASMIERVEVVTNASARYDASGTGGIINIVLKKDRKKGINGAIDVSGGLPQRYGVGLNLNARKKDVNFFINYGFRNRTGPGKGYTYQEFYGDVPIPFSEQYNTRERGGNSHSIRAGMDFFLSERDVLTGSILYRIGDDYSDALTEFRDFDANRVLTDISERRQDETEEESNLNYELNYERKFSEKGRKFVAQLQYRSETETEAADYVETAFDLNGIATGEDPLLQRSLNAEENGTLLLQADYVHPFTENMKMEFGGKATFRKIGNDYLVEEFGNSIWNRLDNVSNNFNYNEDIAAVYGIFGNKIGKWSYQVGLRAEHSHVVTELVETNELNDRSYTNLFPSAHVNYEIDPANSFQVSYSRRISRPRFWYLNPFFNFSNQRNFWGGNPNLDPEFTDSYEVGYIKYWDNVTLGSSVYYRKTTGVIERIARVDGEGITRTQPENLSTENAFGMEFTTTADITKGWRVDANANFYSERTFGEVGDLTLENEAITFSNRVTSKIKLWKDTEFQTRFWYRAPQNTTQGRQRSMYSFDLGLSTDLLQKKATLTLAVRDLFNTRKWRSETYGSGFFMDRVHQRRAGQTTLSFNYRINQDNKRQRRGGDRGDMDGGDGGDMEF